MRHCRTTIPSAALAVAFALAGCSGVDAATAAVTSGPVIGVPEAPAGPVEPDVVEPVAETVTARPVDVVIMGDSFAEGWALPSSDEITARHWTGVVNMAKTGTMTTTVGPQVDDLRARVASGKVPDALVVVIGGNDLNLLGALGDCLLGTCPDPAEFHPNQGWIEMALVDLYQELDGIVNSPDAIAARNGATAPVLVGAYPTLLRDDADITLGPLRIAQTNAERVNGIIADLNDTVEAAADQAGGVVRFVNLRDAFAGHLLGDPQPYLAITAHPNAAGFDAIMTRFAEAMDAALGG